MKLQFKWTAEEIIAEGRTTRENVESVKTWISDKNDENVPFIIQNEMIVIFLLSCRNDIELTKRTIISFYSCKKNGSEIFDNRSVENADIKLALNTLYMSSIPVRTDDNDVIHYFRLEDSNYANFDLIPVMKIIYMLLDISLEKNPPNGLIIVMDMRKVGFMHLTKLKIDIVKKSLQFLEEGFPIQLKSVHSLNTVYFMNKVMTIIKVFMKSELMNMFHFHPPDLDQEKLFQFIPKKCLPKEYGGDLPSVKELHERTLTQFKEKQQFWDIEEKIRKQRK